MEVKRLRAQIEQLKKSELEKTQQLEKTLAERPRREERKTEDGEVRSLRLTVNRLETETRRMNEELGQHKPLAREEEACVRRLYNALDESLQALTGKTSVSERELMKVLSKSGVPADDLQSACRVTSFYAGHPVTKKNGDVIRVISV